MFLSSDKGPLLLWLEKFSFSLLCQLLRRKALDVAVISNPNLGLESVPVKVFRAKDISADNRV